MTFKSLQTLADDLDASVSHLVGEHGYRGVRDAYLGNAQGKILATGDMQQRRVWVHFDDQSAASQGAYTTATLIPGCGVNWVEDPNLLGQKVRVGYPPAAMGIQGLAVIMILLDGTQMANGGVTPTEQSIDGAYNPHLTVSAQDSSVVVNNVGQIVFPAGWVVDSGNNTATIVPTGFKGGGGGTSPIVPGLSTSPANSAIAVQPSADITLPSTLTVLDFPTTWNTQGYGRLVPSVLDRTTLTFTNLNQLPLDVVIIPAFMFNVPINIGDHNQIAWQTLYNGTVWANGFFDTAIISALGTAYGATISLTLPNEGDTVQVKFSSTIPSTKILALTSIFSVYWNQALPGYDNPFVIRSTIDISGMSGGGNFPLRDINGRAIKIPPAYVVRSVLITPPASSSTSGVAITDGGSNTIASADNFDLSEGVPNLCLPNYTVPGTAPLPVIAAMTGAVGSGSQKITVELEYG